MNIYNDRSPILTFDFKNDESEYGNDLNFLGGCLDVVEDPSIGRFEFISNLKLFHIFILKDYEKFWKNKKFTLIIISEHLCA